MPAVGPSPLGGPRKARKCCTVQAGLAGNSSHHRMMSGKYDMDILRELSLFEEETTKELVQMLQVESEDELPGSLDLHQLVELKEGERRAFLESTLKACASDVMPAFIDKCLERISELDARVSNAISAAGPAAVFATDRRRGIVQAGLASNSLVRMMSAKYDMGTLRELSRTEDEVIEELVQMFKVESEDELPVPFDLQQLVYMKEGERRAFLENLLQACASDAMPAFIDKCLERINDLGARVSDAVSVTVPTTTFAYGTSLMKAPP
eukprot:g6926.t1